jgi:SAM-dependent methyltransferase
MKTSAFDQQHLPTLSVQEGYTAYAATYDEVKAQGLIDYWLIERIQTVVWGHLEAVADLACGTGCIGVWLKEHGVHLLDGVDLTEAMLEQARAKGVYRLFLANTEERGDFPYRLDILLRHIPNTPSRLCTKLAHRGRHPCAFFLVSRICIHALPRAGRHGRRASFLLEAPGSAGDV